MGGLGLVLNTAKDALLVNQYALDVVSHNVANVNTPGYSRQTPVLETTAPAPYGGFLLGRGVEIKDIVRATDSFIETRLRDRETDLMAMQEKEVYMDVLEGIFNENSGRSLSAQFADFWNAWQDLSNNPSGNSERDILLETGSLLAQSFSGLAEDLEQLETEIRVSLETGLPKVNELTSQIATLNKQIINVEVSRTANDLRDQRNNLLRELSQYVDINSYEYEDGSMTVVLKNGYSLVDKGDSYDMGLDGDDVVWEGSGGSLVRITDRIEGGKIGGWLDIRDEVIPKYSADLDELAGSTIWEVNKEYALGVGLVGFSSLTGTYAASDAGAAIGTAASGLDFSDKITDGSLDLWLYDNTGAVVGGGPTTLNITANTTTLNALAADISAIHANLSATVSNGTLEITGSNGYTFAFSGDTSNALACLGVNTFFSGNDAVGMEVNSTLSVHKEYIAAGRLGASGDLAKGDNTNALAISELQSQQFDLKRWTCERGSAADSQDVTETLESYLYSFLGSVGVLSESVKRSKEYNEVIVNQLNERRDSISAVSLDEEMTKLIQYQHGYAAAAKLISAADEMLKALLDTR